MWDYTEKYPVLLEEKESDGTIVRYTYAGNRERAYADVTKNSENAKAQVYSLYTDRLGSTRWALDENAEVAAKTEYDAWGKPETETVSSKLNGINISKSYTGYVYDETTGYWNAGARMYNSTDREFIQKDPKAGSITEPMTQNGYTYCGDNPLYYIDPDGCSYISTLGNAGRTAFNVVKSGVAGGLGFYTRICCEIDNMPTWAKAAVGTTGIIIAGASGVGAAAIAEAVIASAGISAVTDGAFYSIYALNNGSFSKSELKDTVINGAANGYMFAGAGLGVAGIRNAAKSGKLAGFMADEAGSVSYEGGTGERLIPGMEGVVTGGDSTKLGKNMMESMALPRGTNWTGHQAQHIIPAEMTNHPVLQRIGMDLDNASNGLFLRTPADDISAMSRHRGYHSTYNEFVKTQLDAMDISQSVDVLQEQVYDLQQNLKYLQQNGLPLYPSQGATVDLWQRSLERIQ